MRRTGGTASRKGRATKAGLRVDSVARRLGAIATPWGGKLPAKLGDLLLSYEDYHQAGGRGEREDCSQRYGKGFDTETFLGRGSVPEFLSVFGVFGRFPWVSGRVSYPPGPILGSVLLLRFVCRQKSPCRQTRGDGGTHVVC